VTFCNIPVVYGEELLGPRPIIKVEDHPLSAVITVHSVYSQLPTISEGRLLHLQTEDARCLGDRDSREEANETLGYKRQGIS
jgi:hypothetical protein